MAIKGKYYACNSPAPSKQKRLEHTVCEIQRIKVESIAWEHEYVDVAGYMLRQLP